MSSLTSQQINNTYPGLLKLANSTTGITSTVQSVEDGLGGDTGLKIKQNYLGGSGLIPTHTFDTVNMVGGPGTTGSGTGTAFNSSSHNVLQSIIFYDKGHISYSAITAYVGTVSTTTDSLECGIFSAQPTPTGWQPGTQVGSTFTISGTDVTTLGFRKITFPSNITLTEGGAYFLAFVVTNPTAVAPTVRFRGPINASAHLNFISMMYGYVLDTTGAAYCNPFKAGSGQNMGQCYTSIAGPLQSSYVPVTFATTTSINQSIPGFVLHPVN